MFFSMALHFNGIHPKELDLNNFCCEKIATQCDLVTKRHTNPNNIAHSFVMLRSRLFAAAGIKTMNNAPTTTLGPLLMPAGVPATKVAWR
jgi:hypothetical protein